LARRPRASGAAVLELSPDQREELDLLARGHARRSPPCTWAELWWGGQWEGATAGEEKEGYGEVRRGSPYLDSGGGGWRRRCWRDLDVGRGGRRRSTWERVVEQEWEHVRGE
jgi:hypothetical protein